MKKLFLSILAVLSFVSLKSQSATYLTGPFSPPTELGSIIYLNFPVQRTVFSFDTNHVEVPSDSFYIKKYFIIKEGDSLNYLTGTGKPKLFPTNLSQFTNGPGYVNQTGVRTSISCTTLGTGAATYDNVTGILNIPTPAPYTAGTGISIIGNVITNTARDQVVTISAGSGINVSGSYPNFTIANTGTVTPAITAGPGIQITGTWPNITISTVNQSPVAVTRATNINFTPASSSTRNTLCIYNITCTATNPLIAGTSSGTATLEYSTNGGSTWSPANVGGNSSSVALTVSVQLTSGQTAALVGIIPQSNSVLVRIRTTVTGSASVSSAVGTETPIN